MSVPVDGGPTTVGSSWGPIALDDGGRGEPAVVLLHSLAGSRRHWSRQLDHLRPDRRALALDLPGHGASAGWPEGTGLDELGGVVAEVLEAIGLERCVLVGHSFGAGVAINAAAARVPAEGLLLVDPVGDHRNEREEIRVFVDRLRSEAYNRVVSEFWEEILSGARPATREVVLEDLAATDSGTVIRGMEALLTHDPEAALGRYGGPARIVFNPQFEQPSSFHCVIPDLPRSELGDASHWIQMDRPARFNRLLEDFLAGMQAAARG